MSITHLKIVLCSTQYIPIHLHNAQKETLHCLFGNVSTSTFDDDKNIPFPRLKYFETIAVDVAFKKAAKM